MLTVTHIRHLAE